MTGIGSIGEADRPRPAAIATAWLALVALAASAILALVAGAMALQGRLLASAALESRRAALDVRRPDIAALERRLAALVERDRALPASVGGDADQAAAAFAETLRQALAGLGLVETTIRPAPAEPAPPGARLVATVDVTVPSAGAGAAVRGLEAEPLAAIDRLDIRRTANGSLAVRAEVSQLWVPPQ